MPNIPEERELSQGEMPSTDTLTTEEEVQRLREELTKKEEALRVQSEKEAPRELVKESMVEKGEEKAEKEKIKLAKEQPSKAPPPKPVAPPPQIKDADLAEDLKYVMSLDKPKQVKTLVYISLKKGVNHAANLAKQMKDPYILDEFHDTLVNQLYDILKKRKKI
jgi:hypothetical protein